MVLLEQIQQLLEAVEAVGHLVGRELQDKVILVELPLEADTVEPAEAEPAALVVIVKQHSVLPEQAALD
jgi:hypothetical protein